MEGFGVKPVPELGWQEPKNIFLLLSLYKESFTKLLCTAGKGQQVEKNGG